MTSATRFRISALLMACALSTAMPSHAFWGLLGKAGKAAAAGGEAASAASKAAKAGKAAEAAQTAGKTAAVGTVAAGGAELAAASTRHSLIFAADDAAHIAGKAPLLASDSAAMAATPPEVARYLTKPADQLSKADSAQMLKLYQQMMEQAGKSGDFSVVEKMPQLHAAQASKPATAYTESAPAAINTTAASHLPSAELSFHALRLLSHAANSRNHDAALRELQAYCARQLPEPQQKDQTELCRNVPKRH